ncbi:hypothetical protein J5277_09350 [Rhizobium sp. 16-449-1b]|uniref:hypothetical protein n=1 Tax=Rhizobium sp. 16-449-1b TaxID=2819989 RepID=UPI001ADB8C3F|nr:hypothetical protein [Rhizobium sp. 16-449-1b]MBO9194309.1 hypothetical protein [Rhizobium sp. 16-449-1b]
MRFWRQADLFGVGDKDGSWFISLFDRLTALCQIDLDGFMKDHSLRETFRFHEIDWAGKKVPVARSDFDWIDKDYLSNDEEFPFYQFHVSKALGRVVGFFDESQVFNVLVFDPHHNIQPSEYNDYKIRPTRIGHCQYGSLITIAAGEVEKCTCGVKYSLRERLETEIFDQTGGVLLCRIPEDHHERFLKLRRNGHASDISEIFELGLVAYEDGC